MRRHGLSIIETILGLGFLVIVVAAATYAFGTAQENRATADSLRLIAIIEQNARNILKGRAYTDGVINNMIISSGSLPKSNLVCANPSCNPSSSSDLIVSSFSKNSIVNIWVSNEVGGDPPPSDGMTHFTIAMGEVPPSACVRFAQVAFTQMGDNLSYLTITPRHYSNHSPGSGYTGSSQEPLSEEEINIACHNGATFFFTFKI